MAKLTDDVGQYHFDTLAVLNPKIKEAIGDRHLIKRCAQRGMEEYVELMLECGCTAGEIFEALVDALHNEAQKAHRYPSALKGHGPHIPNVVVEITDVKICLETLRHICQITQDQIFEHTDTKLELLRMRAIAGELVMIDWNIYKKTARKHS